MASRFAMHHAGFTFTIVITLCIISQALAVAEPPIGEATALSGNSTAHSATAQVHHKSLTPLAGTDIGLFIVVAVALFIASGAGVGGGVLVVPSLLIISQFSAIAAVALSNITILASSVANLGFNLPRKSVLRPGPLIDWDLVLLFGPPTVIGSIAGSYVNMVIPSWVTKVCLFILLVPMAWRMVDKARSLYKRETAAKEAVKSARVASFEPDDLDSAAGGTVPDSAKQPAGAGEATVAAAAGTQAATEVAGSDGSSAADGAAAIRELLGPKGGCVKSVAAGNTLQQHVQQQEAADVEMGCVAHAPAGAGQQQRQQQQQRELQEQQQTVLHVQSGTSTKQKQQHKSAMSCWQHPSKDPDWSCRTDPDTCQTVRDKLMREQARMVPPFQCGLLVLLLADVAVASLLAGYLLTCGSWQYWLLVLSPLLVMLLVWAVARHHVLWKAAWRTKLELIGAGDLKWDTQHTTTIYPAICISAGVIAGMLGLGGGLVLAPLMLELGVNPAVSAASTQVTLLISSSTSAIVYAVNGAVPWDYGIVLIVIGFLATLSGQWLVSWLVRRLGRPSVLVITLAVMFSAATFAAAAVLVLTFIDLSQHPEKWLARKGVCLTQ